MDGYNPKLHALTGEAHGMAAALNVPRVSCCAQVSWLVGWLQGTAHQTSSYIYKWGDMGPLSNGIPYKWSKIKGFHSFFSLRTESVELCHHIYKCFRADSVDPQNHVLLTVFNLGFWIQEG